MPAGVVDECGRHGNVWNEPHAASIMSSQGEAMKNRSKTNRMRAARKIKMKKKSLRKSKGERKYPS
jgi:hypothetical protein